MFTLKKKATCWWPVKVKWPDEKVTGRELTHEFEIELRLLDQAEIEKQEADRMAIIETAAREASEISGDDADANAAAQSESLTKRLSDHSNQTYLDTITGWRNIRDDETKDEIPFSDEMLLLALAQPRVRAAIQIAVNEAIHGGARSKN
jgi:hypothetical protein